MLKFDECFCLLTFLQPIQHHVNYFISINKKYSIMSSSESKSSQKPRDNSDAELLTGTGRKQSQTSQSSQHICKQEHTEKIAKDDKADKRIGEELVEIKKEYSKAQLKTSIQIDLDDFINRLERLEKQIKALKQLFILVKAKREQTKERELQGLQYRFDVTRNLKLNSMEEDMENYSDKEKPERKNIQGLYSKYISVPNSARQRMFETYSNLTKGEIKCLQEGFSSMHIQLKEQKESQNQICQYIEDLQERMDSLKRYFFDSAPEIQKMKEKEKRKQTNEEEEQKVMEQDIIALKNRKEQYRKKIGETEDRITEAYQTKSQTVDQNIAEWTKKIS